jgi:acyl carrier protein
MDRKELEKKVNEIIVDKLGVEPGVVKETSELDGDLGADSLDCVELLMEFEREFDIAITDEEAYKVSTVKDIYELIEEKGA